MGWLIFGTLCLVAGLYTPLWRLFGFSYEKDSTWTDGRVTTTVIRMILTILGAVAVSINFPDIIHGVSSPGWVILGLILLGVCVLPYYFGQFKLLWEDADGELRCEDCLAVFTLIRTIGVVIGSLALAIGIGTGVPHWGEVKGHEPTVCERAMENARHRCGGSNKELCAVAMAKAKAECGVDPDAPEEVTEQQ